MQLNTKDRGVRRQLAAAVFTLLGASIGHADPAAINPQGELKTLKVDPALLGPGPVRRQVPTEDAVYAVAPLSSLPTIVPTGTEQPWQADTGFLYYKEGDGRIQTAEAVINLKKVYADDSSLNVKLTVDALTGGSPNGAMPSKSVQTFSTPSGNSLVAPVVSTTPSIPQTYTTPSGKVVTVGSGQSVHSTLYNVAPGQLPIDSTFQDQRISLSLGKEQALGSANRLSYGGAFSHERDFMSASGNVGIARDFNDKNTTLSAGLNLEADSIRPIGGAPVPWSEYGLFNKQGNKSKRVEDVLVGVTQIMTRRWITQLNYSVDASTGYQNDPYKILSVLDSQGVVQNYVYENRPESRTRRSLYWDNKFALDHDVVELSLRHMTDNWGITSNTVDLHYHWTFLNGFYLEPHVRHYTQTAADFYRFFLTAGDPLLTYASADPRLAAFAANTIGIKFGVPTGPSSAFSFRVERYIQKGNGPSMVPAQLQGLDLYPGLKSWIVQGGLRFSF